MRAPAVVLALATGLLLVSGVAVASADEPADVCLELAAEAVSSEEWSALADPVAEAVAARPQLFPDPTIDRQGARLDIASGHPGLASGAASCLEPGYEWTARFGQSFLAAGADLMLAEAPTTPGIDSAVDIEWYPDEARLRTTLVFAGPLDIPNGTCWVDDALSVAEGSIETTGDQGMETSPFAEGACRRFFEYLPDGGAGEQAVTLLPTEVVLPDGGLLRFVAEDVLVRPDALLIAGSLAREG